MIVRALVAVVAVIAILVLPDSATAAPESWRTKWDIFTNYSSYMPRTHCMVNAEGEPDWPWIIGLIVLSIGVVVAYVRIYTFWIATHRSQDPRDQNHKMFELANIFFWCAICGYAFSVVMFMWPAYRLLALALVLLNIWSWKFVLTDLNEFRISLNAKSYQRQLAEELRDRNCELERLVTQRTAEADEARAAAERANIAKSAFLATMSHEIRTPMTAILGYADLLDSGELDRDAEPAHAATATIRRNAHHLLTLINDILDMSKVEAGRMDVEQIPMSPAQVVHDAVQLLQNRASENGLALAVEFATDVPAAIESDPTRLRQILVNLIGNAIKFTERGSVTVRVSCAVADERLQIAVIDTGIGMTAEQRDAIARFEAFSQADSSTTRRFGGTGLGLRISNALAERLGGGLEIDSEVGTGSTFTLSIATGPLDGVEFLTPAAALVPPPIVGRDGISSPCRADTTVLDGATVLLVDDGPDNLRLVSFLLRRAGAQVLTAEDGAAAVAAITSLGSAVDLVLMDVHMPVLDGYGATRAVRAAGHDVPIIALTADAMAGARERCLDAGCNDHLPKPVDRDDLVRVCAMWLDRLPADAA